MLWRLEHRGRAKATSTVRLTLFFYPMPMTYPSSQPHVQLDIPSCISGSMCADSRVANRQVAEMHLNERLEKSREALGQQLAVGQQKVSSAYNRLWAEMEAMREAQRARAEEQRLQAEKEGKSIDAQGKCKSRHDLPSLFHVLIVVCQKC
jgi:hypothetical protein